METQEAYLYAYLVGIPLMILGCIISAYIDEHVVTKWR